MQNYPFNPPRTALGLQGLAVMQS